MLHCQCMTNKSRSLVKIHLKLTEILFESKKNITGVFSESKLTKITQKKSKKITQNSANSICLVPLKHRDANT